MSNPLVELAGHTLELLAERAVYWAARRTLLLADLHLGKAAAFRRAGLAIPEGDTEASLQRLDALIERWQPAEVILLGDLLHVRLGEDPALGEQILSWRARHAERHVTAIIGNHDRGLERLAPSLQCCAEGIERDGLVLRHHPPTRPTARAWLAGHWHPVARLAAGGDSLRVPAFVEIIGEGLVLPAFGGLTGGTAIAAGRGRRRYISSGERVFALDAAAAAD